MNNERTLYISPDDDLPRLCTRLEHAHSRRVTLVIPIHAEHLHAFGTWRMLHAYTRRRGIRVHIVSTSAYIRSIAHSAHFTVAKTLNTPQQDTSVYTRPAPRMKLSTDAEESMNVGEGINLTFASDDDGVFTVAQQEPSVFPFFDRPSLAFPDDDVLPPILTFPDVLAFPDDDEVLPPPLPMPDLPPARVSNQPQPLNMPRLRRTRPLTQPRLPWDDDVDDEMLPPKPPHKLIRRRTNPLVQSMRRRRVTTRNIQRRQPVSANVISLAPILCIGIFIVVRSIVQYMRRRAL